MNNKKKNLIYAIIEGIALIFFIFIPIYFPELPIDVLFIWVSLLGCWVGFLMISKYGPKRK